VKGDGGRHGGERYLSGNCKGLGWWWQQQWRVSGQCGNRHGGC